MSSAIRPLSFQPSPKLWRISLRWCAVVLAGFRAVSLFAEPAFSDPAQRGQEHLAALTALEGLRDWTGAHLEQVRLVQPSKTDWGAQPAPRWQAQIVDPQNRSGYMIWENRGAGRLTDFCLDGVTSADAPECRALAGVPAIQQFALPGESGPVASGCVPTAGASLVAFWAAHGAPAWRGEATEEALTLRIRGRLKMETIPDTAGFTGGKMALAGCFPEELARGLEADARAHGVPARIRLARFDWARLRAEIEAGRPVLVSCTVPVPQKPELTWDHEVVAVGWAKIAGELYVGVIDNFLPVKTPGTVRWIHSRAFDSSITVNLDPAAAADPRRGRN
jgi:hypothetical protein